VNVLMNRLRSDDAMPVSCEGWCVRPKLCKEVDKVCRLSIRAGDGPVTGYVGWYQKNVLQGKQSTDRKVSNNILRRHILR
jgi:hypothetical protein